MLADGSDANTATVALGYAEAITNGFNRELRRAARSNSRSITAAGLVQPRAEEPLVHHPRADRGHHDGDHRAAHLAHGGAGMGERHHGAADRHPGAAGRAVPRQDDAVLRDRHADVLFSVAMGVWVFGVPLRGSFVFLLGVSAMFLLGGLASAFSFPPSPSRSWWRASWRWWRPSCPLSCCLGFLYSIDNMPRPLQVVTHVVQARYFVAVLKNIFLKAARRLPGHRAHIPGRLRADRVRRGAAASSGRNWIA